MPRAKAKPGPLYYSILNGWIATIGDGGEWRWVQAIENGWIAGVEDMSQTYDPPRLTEYRAYCISGARLEWGGVYGLLSEAKSAARSLALSLPPFPDRNKAARLL